jgi:hypothetical protein
MIANRNRNWVYALAATLALATTASAQPWTCWGGGDGRNAALYDVPAIDYGGSGLTLTLNDLLPSEWTPDGTVWSPVGAGSPVVYNNRAYVYAQGGSGFAATAGAIFCLDLPSGDYAWGVDVGAPQMGSWSSPALDLASETLVIGSGGGPHMHGIDAATGVVRWTATLEKTVVNASPDTGGGKAYITDYDGFGTTGILYAINNDPTDAVADGTIDWQATIGGASGATPTYHDGVVYVGSINDGSGGSGWPAATGTVRAFEAATGDLIWQVAYPDDAIGVGNPFGGLSVHDGHVYIGSYEFYGDHQSATILKIDATDTGGPGTYPGGDQARIQWEALSNRTDSIPVVWDLGDGREVLISSGGINGFGTTHTVTFFDAADGDLLGSTALFGWPIPNPWGGPPTDGGFAGNWTYQPIVVNGVLYVGGPEAEWFGPSQNLWGIDLAAIDWDAAFAGTPFTLAHTDPGVTDLGPGSSPAYYTNGIGGALFTYGPGGLFVAHGDVEAATARVPEPATLAVLAAGCLALRRRRRMA